MTTEVKLDGVQANLIALAHQRYEQAVGPVQRAAAADVEAAIAPLRIAIGVPEGVSLHIAQNPDGTYVAAWETPDIEPVAE